MIVRKKILTTTLIACLTFLCNSVGGTVINEKYVDLLRDKTGIEKFAFQVKFRCLDIKFKISQREKLLDAQYKFNFLQAKRKDGFLHPCDLMGVSFLRDIVRQELCNSKENYIPTTYYDNFCKYAPILIQLEQELMWRQMPDQYKYDIDKIACLLDSLKQYRLQGINTALMQITLHEQLSHMIQMYMFKTSSDYQKALKYFLDFQNSDLDDVIEFAKNCYEYEQDGNISEAAKEEMFKFFWEKCDKIVNQFETIESPQNEIIQKKYTLIKYRKSGNSMLGIFFYIINDFKKLNDLSYTFEDETDK